MATIWRSTSCPSGAARCSRRFASISDVGWSAVLDEAPHAGIEDAFDVSWGRSFASVEGRPFAVLAPRLGTGRAFREAAAAWLDSTTRGCLTYVAIRARPVAAPAVRQAVRAQPIPGLPRGFDESWLDALPPPHRGFFLIRVRPGRVHLLLLQDTIEGALAELAGPIDRVLGGLPHPETASTQSAVEPVTVVGAGLAGACTARALADHGVPVTVLDRGPPGEDPARGSTNPWLLCRPHLAAGPAPLAALTQIGWQLRSVYGPALTLLRGFAMSPRGGKLEGHHHKIRARWAGSPWLTALEPTGLPRSVGYAQSAAGLLDGPRAIQHLLDGIDVRWNTVAPDSSPGIVATGTAPAGLRAMPLSGSVGQSATRVLPEGIAVAGGGYLVDTHHGTVIGATRHRSTTTGEHEADDLLDRARERFGVTLGPLEVWSGVRTKTRDHAPIVGLTPTGAITVAHGAKGSTTAPAAAALLEAQWLGLPWPVPRRVARALDPERRALTL